MNSKTHMQIRWVHLSQHVVQFRVPTPTLPPAFETNTYLIYDGDIGVLVDAGTTDAALIDNLVELVCGVGVSRITALIATHYHRDHVQGLPALARAFTAPIHVHPLDMPNASLEMGIPIADIREIPTAFQVGTLGLQIHHAPGHTHGHVHIKIPADGVILVGDHLAGDGSVWIGPPDGHMGDYYRALEHIMQSGCRIAGPGHGQALEDASASAQATYDRRRAREDEICGLLASGPCQVTELVHALYGGLIPEQAMWAAEKTVKAHLQHLIDLGRVTRVHRPQTHSFAYTLNS